MSICSLWPTSAAQRKSREAPAPGAEETKQANGDDQTDPKQGENQTDDEKVKKPQDEKKEQPEDEPASAVETRFNVSRVGLVLF